MRLIKIELKNGETVQLQRVPSTKSLPPTYRVVKLQKDTKGFWREIQIFQSIKYIKHAEMLFNSLLKV